MPRKQRLFGPEAAILVALLELGKLDITRLCIATGIPRATITSNVNRLIKEGLLSEEYESQPPGRRFVWLTDKGARVAKLLKQVFEELGYPVPQSMPRA